MMEDLLSRPPFPTGRRVFYFANQVRLAGADASASVGAEGKEGMELLIRRGMRARLHDRNGWGDTMFELREALGAGVRRAVA